MPYSCVRIAEQHLRAFVIIHPMKQLSARHRRYLAVTLAHVDLVRGGRRVLRDVRWRISPGQRWVLQGTNGAGKTQLLKLIAGDVWPAPRSETRREYRWRGECATEPYEIKEEIAYLGSERQDRYQHYDWNYRVRTVVGTGIQRSDTPLRPLNAAERSQVTRLLRRFGILALASRLFLSLSQGERRLVLLARALAWHPALLLLDEPLNGLDAPHRARFLAALDSLSRTQLPWVYAGHRPEEVPGGVTHWASLRQGRLRTGRWRRRSPPADQKAPRRPMAVRARTQDRTMLIELRSASVWRAGRIVLGRLNVRIQRGECWVVHGANGSGKSTLLATLYGEHAVADDGSIRRCDHKPGTPLTDFQRRVGYVTPELQATLPRPLSVVENVVSGLRGAHHLDGEATGSERRVALRALGLVGARRLAERRFGDLSYGQARRVLFARALARGPDIVLLDEPYTGLDSTTRQRLGALVGQWILKGRTIVIASHHQDDWPRGTTHEIELGSGRTRYVGPLRTIHSPARVARL